MAIDSVDIERLLQPFFAKIGLRDELTRDEQNALISSAGEIVEIDAGRDLVKEGERPTRSLLVARGYTCRYRIVPDGARQLMALHISGDFVDLHSFLLKEMDHSVATLTKCVIVAFPHERLVKVTERFPHLTRLLWLMTLLDGAIHREWLVGMGRSSAIQRTAHLICETYTRLHAIGLVEGRRFSFPITQVALADAIGISTVHVNRVLQELRQDGLFTWDGGDLEIWNWPSLVAIAEFDDRYLHLVREHR